MEKELILLYEYCIKSQVEPDFIFSLEDEGLIKIEIVDEEKYILLEQLNILETCIRLHQDLCINIAGLDVICNLLLKIQAMEKELSILRRKIESYRSLWEKEHLEEF